jgi:HEAT repeat protein
VRAQIAWALGRIGSDAAAWTEVVVSVLVTALRDEDSLVREEAAAALARLARHAEPAWAALARSVEDHHPLVRERARHALAALESDRSRRG